MGSRAQARSCGSRAQLLRGMWDPPRPGPEPVSPALAGRLSATAPPGKPMKSVLDGVSPAHSVRDLSLFVNIQPVPFMMLHFLKFLDGLPVPSASPPSWYVP